MTTTEERIKSYAAPALMAALLMLTAWTWKLQQDRIGVLEMQAAASSNALAALTESQKNSLADRSDFQAATTLTLNKLADTMWTLNLSVAKLTALQDERNHDNLPR